MTPSAGETALTSKIVSGTRIAWWWLELTSGSPRSPAGSSAASREPAAMRPDGLDDLAAGLVIDRGLADPERESRCSQTFRLLHAVADGQDRLVEIEGILEEQLIDGGAGRVGLTALGDRIFAISLRIHIVSAAGQQNSLHAGEQPGDAVLPLMQAEQRWVLRRRNEGRRDTAEESADCRLDRCWWAREWRCGRHMAATV